MSEVMKIADTIALITALITMSSSWSPRTRQRLPVESDHARRMAATGPIGSSVATTGVTSVDAKRKTVAMLPAIARRPTARADRVTIIAIAMTTHSAMNRRN